VRYVRLNRSTNAFCDGEPGGMKRSATPRAAHHSVKACSLALPKQKMTP